MEDPWGDWCEAHRAFLWNLLTEKTDRFMTGLAAAQRITPPQGYYPHPEQVVAGMLFELVGIAAIAESFFGPDDDLAPLANLMQHIVDTAALWGATGPVEAFMASVIGEPATTDAANATCGPPDIKEEPSTERAVSIIAKWVLGSPAAPAPGRGRQAILKRLVMEQFRRQGRPLGDDTARKYTAPVLREWESKKRAE